MKRKQSIFTKTLCLGCACSILCSSCATMDQQTRTSVATQTGAIVGGTFGAALGDHIDGNRGSFWGSMLGSLAGIAVGAAVASSGQQPHTDQQVSRVAIQPAPFLLIKDIILKDRNGNQCIDAGEGCQITFILVNNGDLAAHNVTPRIKAKGNAKKIRLSAPVSIRRITLDDEISYTVQARASESLKTGSADFEIRMEDGQGNELCKEQFSVCTRGRSKR